ncbi:hypothetical protein QGN29_00775 [Temperatibacter marinus]|uniref:Cell division coordinator CpoB n=1 Tax=Temperatibacter marinus TaxID=1456591 RepID=A0AA52EDV1_9PROT|nr:hypothetical protein [Temperatibacter marinus]WND02895.1 hypothetical protein QGN29_00775 [Temperatibacter marinus]
MRIFLAVVLLVSGTIFSVGDAHAQSRKELNAKITNLDLLVQQLKIDLKRAADGDGKKMRIIIADMSAKMTSLERQLRALTGRLEEMEERQRQFSTEIDGLRQEMAFQLQALKAAPATEVPTEDAGQSEQNATNVDSTAIESSSTVEATTPTNRAPEALVNEGVSTAITLPEGTDKQQYDFAFSFIHKQDLPNGEVALKQFIEANPSSSLLSNARYWLGRVYQRQNKIPLAAGEFLAIIETYPNSTKYPDALVDLADVLVKLGEESGQICAILAEFNGMDKKVSARLRARADRFYKQAKCQ